MTIISFCRFQIAASTRNLLTATFGNSIEHFGSANTEFEAVSIRRFFQPDAKKTERRKAFSASLRDLKLPLKTRRTKATSNFDDKNFRTYPPLADDATEAQ